MRHAVHGGIGMRSARASHHIGTMCAVCACFFLSGSAPRDFRKVEICRAICPEKQW